MANLSKIRYLMEQKNIKVSDLCGKLNITRQQLYHIIKSNTTSINTLENIAKEFKVPISYFFDDDTNEVQEPPGEYKNVSVDEEIKNISDSLKKIVNKIIAENKATI
jgi:transcriptional regulator with XRE-family HTH domain